MIDTHDMPAFLAPFREGPVAVFGGGVSGRGVQALLNALNIPLQIFDHGPLENACAHFDVNAARAYPLVVFSPAFSAAHPWMQSAREGGCRMLSEMDFGSFFWPGKVLAVTGTNGKTTLVDFLTFAFKRTGVDAIATGNFGYPVSRLVETNPTARSVAVCEVSSFQAESLEHLSPDDLLWTHFADDHLDRHGSTESYFRAKWHLVERLRDGGLWVASGQVLDRAAKLDLRPPAGICVVRMDDAVLEPPPDCWFAAYPQRENFRTAATFWRETGRDMNALADAARAFNPPPHRLRKIARIGDVEFWDDSKATNFSAALAALEHFNRPIQWIGGGLSKGGDMAGFCEGLADRIDGAFLIGRTAPELADHLRRKGMSAHVFADLEAAVAAAYAAAGAAGVVLLSPGFASMDQFRDYTDRGINFERAVFSLKQRALAAKPSECSPLSKVSS